MNGHVKPKKTNGVINRWVICFPKKSDEILSVKGDEEAIANTLLSFIRSLEPARRNDKASLKGLCRDRLDTLREEARQDENDVAASDPESASDEEAKEEEECPEDDEMLVQDASAAWQQADSTFSHFQGIINLDEEEEPLVQPGLAEPPDPMASLTPPAPPASVPGPSSPAAGGDPMPAPAAGQTVGSTSSSQPPEPDGPQVDCLICFSQYDTDQRKPVASSKCGHTISCLVCVETLLGTRRAANCPICRQLFKADEWKPNYGMIEILPLLLARRSNNRSSAEARNSSSSNSAGGGIRLRPAPAYLSPDGNVALRPSVPTAGAVPELAEPPRARLQPNTAVQEEPAHPHRVPSVTARQRRTRLINEPGFGAEPRLRAEAAPRAAGPRVQAAPRAAGRGRGAMQVPSESVVFLLQNSGHPIRQVEEEFSVRIEVEKNTSGRSTGKLTIRDSLGSLGRIAEAVERIRELAHEESVSVPEALRGRVIGRGGSVIQSLLTLHGNRVRSRSEAPGIILNGSRDAVEACARTIRDFVEKTADQTKEMEVRQAFAQHLGNLATIARAACQMAQEVNCEPFPPTRHRLRIEKMAQEGSAAMVKLVFEGSGAAAQAAVQIVQEKVDSLAVRETELPVPPGCPSSALARLSAELDRQLAGIHSVTISVGEVIAMSEGWMEANELDSTSACRIQVIGAEAACAAAALEAFEVARQLLAVRQEPTNRSGSPWRRRSRSRSRRRDWSHQRPWREWGAEKGKGKSRGKGKGGWDHSTGKGKGKHGWDHSKGKGKGKDEWAPKGAGRGHGMTNHI